MNSKQPFCCATGDDPTFADQLKALGHPVRFKLVQQLAERQTPCCGELCACFEHSQSTISQHLSMLVNAGLVRVERQGNRMLYELERQAVASVSAALEQLTILPEDTGLDGADADRKR